MSYNFLGRRVRLLHLEILLQNAFKANLERMPLQTQPEAADSEWHCATFFSVGTGYAPAEGINWPVIPWSTKSV